MRDLEKRKASEAAFHKRNPDYRAKMAKRWRDNHPDWHKNYHRKPVRIKANAKYELNRKLAKFNLTESQYFELFERQANKCKICGQMFDKLKRKAHIDHCHATGKVRGLLCVNCNTALGLVKDDIDILSKMVAYLATWAA